MVCIHYDPSKSDLETNADMSNIVQITDARRGNINRVRSIGRYAMQLFRCYQLDASGFAISYENILAEDYICACARADELLLENGWFGVDLWSLTRRVPYPNSSTMVLKRGSRFPANLQ